MDTFEQKIRSLVLSQQRKIDALYAMLASNVSATAKIVRPGENPFRGNKAAKAKIQQAILDFNRRLEAMVRTETRLAWKLANNRADNLAETYMRGMDVPKALRAAYFNPSMAAYNAFQARRTAGLNLSDRVWQIGDQNRQLIGMYLSEGIHVGKSAAAISQDIRQYLKEPNKRFHRVRDPKTGKLGLSTPAKNYHPGRGVYRSSYKNAMRVARTEVNMAYRQADFIRRQRMDFVIGYRVHLSPSHPKLDICDYMAGDYPKTFRFGGWHPHCICYTTANLMPKSQFKKYLNGETAVLKGEQRKLMPKTAELYIAKNSEALNRYKNPPYFLSDNFVFEGGYYRIKKDVGWRRNLGEVTHPKKITHAVPNEDMYKMTAAERDELTQFIDDTNSRGYQYHAQYIGEQWGKARGRHAKGEVIDDLLNYRDEGNIKSYTGGAVYDSLNARLRANGWKAYIKKIKDQSADISDRILASYGRLLNDSLQKLPDFKGTVYRGVRSMPDEAYARYVRAFKSGTPLQEDFFISTSYSESGAFSGTYNFVMNVRGGKLIEKISIHQIEREVLMSPGRRYRVTNITEIGSRKYIYLEEI